MAAKKQVKYKQVPKPVLFGEKVFKCQRCGTVAKYTMEDMLNHGEWCALAKQQNEAAAAAQARRKKRARKNH